MLINVMITHTLISNVAFLGTRYINNTVNTYVYYDIQILEYITMGSRANVLMIALLL